MLECFILEEMNENLKKLLSDKENTKEYFYDVNNINLDETIKSMFADIKKQLIFGLYYDNNFIGIIGLKKKHNVTYTHVILEKQYQKQNHAYTGYNIVFDMIIKNKIYINYGLTLRASIYKTNTSSIKLFKKLEFIEKNEINNTIILEYNLIKKDTELYNRLIKFDFPRNILTENKCHILAYYYSTTPFIMRKPTKKLHKILNNLRNYEPIYIEIDYSINFRKYFKTSLMDKIIKTQYCDTKTEYFDYNCITEYFQERCRMECARYDSEGIKPINYWNNSESLYKIFTEIGDINIDTLYGWFYDNVHTCTYFKITVAYSLYKYLNSKRILDISSGWGDRLVGAIGINAECYHGFDPNECLHTGYKNIINFFGVNKNEYVIKKQGFETAKLTEMYDTVFTSPPYFNLEIYSGDTDQSIEKYNNLDEWKRNFLYKSLKNAWDHILPGGHMAINIEDIINKKTGENVYFTEDMVLYATNKLENIKYLGIYTFTNDLYVFRPIFIWKKI